MERGSSLRELGFSQYEAACYRALISEHPVNGSQLSRLSGIARSRIYDVLRNMIAKGYVVEASRGQYAPLPPDELINRLKARFKVNIAAFEKEIESASRKTGCEYVWTLTGYETVMTKAVSMIQRAKEEIYARLFPKAGHFLDKHLKVAEKRGVKVRYIAMGEVLIPFDIQVVHPEQASLLETIGGRSFDIIADKKEALVGIFETGNEENSPINWTRNRWFVTANRDSLRHDFYHCFLKKTYDNNETLTDHEKKIYEVIKGDN